MRDLFLQPFLVIWYLDQLISMVSFVIVLHHAIVSLTFTLLGTQMLLDNIY